MAKKVIGKNLKSEFIGDQITRFGDETNIFSVGSSFNITTNLEDRLTKNFNGVLGNFSKPITLETLSISSITETNTLLNNNIQIFLNLNKRNVNNFALFGSLKEFIRVSIENIIKSWPASIYVRSFVDDQIKNTVLSYSYNSSLDEASFNIPVSTFKNKFGISFTDKSLLFGNSNNLKDLALNYSNFVVISDLTARTEYNVIGLTGSTDPTTGNINMKLKGNPFPTATGGSLSVSYHIKPKNQIVDKYFNSLDIFESYLLNRDIYPTYTSTFDIPLETEDGVYVIVDKKYTWPTSDGYNIDVDGSDYSRYLEELLILGKNQDNYKTNLISRFFTTDSIKEFDTVDGRVDKLLKIYGREFDEIKKYIDGLSYSTRVTYDKNENISDNLIKNLARILGWGILNSVSEDDLLKAFLGDVTKLRFAGSSKNLTPVEADIELWRRMILNTSWLFKSKGTRKAIEFIFKFIGAPDSLIDIQEYVYLVKQKLNPKEIELKLSGLSQTTIIPSIPETSAKGFIITQNTPFIFNIVNIPIGSASTGTTKLNRSINPPSLFSAVVSVNGVIHGIVNTTIKIPLGQNQSYADNMAANLISNAINLQSLKYSAKTINNKVLIETFKGIGLSGNGIMIVAGTAKFSYSGITGGTNGVPQQTIIFSGQSIENVPIDEFGFPKILSENSRYYFQLSGGWRTEIPIPSSNNKSLESVIGIHLGKYDAGQSYFKPFTDIGFKIDKTVDNKKSWLQYSSQTRNDYDRRLTHYVSDDSKLVLNSKEIGIFLDFAKGIEYDNYVYNKAVYGPIATSGLTFPYPNTTLQQFDVNNITFAQYIDNIYKYFINAKNRKVITNGSGGGYPTLQKLYSDYYFNSVRNFGVQSSALDFNKIKKYIDKIDSFWMDLIEQLLPSTTIWEGGERYRNPIYNTQKFPYKHGINDGSEFQKTINTDKIGTIYISPDWSYAKINVPRTGLRGANANLTGFAFTEANIRSSTRLTPKPRISTPRIKPITSTTNTSLGNLIIGNEIVQNPSNDYYRRIIQEGTYNLDTGILTNYDSIFVSNDILRIGKVYCGNTVNFVQPDFYVTAATKITTTPSVHNISTGGSKSLTFLFTANTSILTSSTSTIFKYDLFRYYPSITGFSATSIYQKSANYSIFSAQSATTKTYSDSPLLTEGEYLIKGSFLFTGSTLFPNNTGKTYDTYALNSEDYYTYSIYDAGLDWYFVIQESPDKPKIVSQDTITTTAKTVTLTATQNIDSDLSNFSINATLNNDVEFKTEVIPVLFEAQSGFTLTYKPIGDIMVNVNGNTLLATDNIGFTGSSGNGEYYLDGKLLYLANPLYLSGDPDTLSVSYITGEQGKGLVNEGIKITGMTTGNTASYNGSKIFFNSGTSKYEYYLNEEIPISTNINVILNGNKLTYGLDFYRSSTNSLRLIFNEHLSVNDTMFVYYISPEANTNKTIKNSLFTAIWNVKPTTNEGLFAVQIALQTDPTYSNILYSATTSYISLSSATATTISKLINSATQQYSLEIGTITGANQTYIYRIKSDKYYRTISGGTLTAITYSDNQLFKTDNTINTY